MSSLTQLIKDFPVVQRMRGLVSSDATTGILSASGVDLVVANVDTTTELLALNTTTYDQQSIMVNNPGGNVGYGFGTVAGIPAEAYIYNSACHWKNGRILLGIYAEALQLTFPAATFVITSIADNGGSVKLIGGVHGLSAANAMTGANASKVRILSGPNWVPGDYAITAITLDTTGTDITIDYDYDAGLGNPVLAVVSASEEYEIARLKLPEMLTTRAKLITEGTTSTPVAGATNLRLKSYLGTTGAAYTSASLFANSNHTTAITESFHGGFQCQNSKSVQKTIFAATAPTGFGTSTTAVLSLALDMSVSTDIIVTILSDTADRPLRIGNITWELLDV